MKKRFALLLLAPCFATAQQHSLEKLWETDTIIAVPESVLPLPKQNLLYVSLIDGGGWDVDGKGGVAKLKADGTGYDPSWITGLNAPKGMGIVGNRLYVADVSEVVVIDIAKGRIEKKIAPDSASGLNDITVDDKGVVYVSDSRTARIWQIKNDQPVLYLENMTGVNGLKSVGDDLYIAKGKSFIKADRNKNITIIAEMPQGGDGIEPVGNGDFIVTAWAGYIYYVHKDGTFETLLDSHVEKKNTADIGYDPEKRILYVPGFNAKIVTAYRLK
jgi:hypothetical protein